MGQQQGALEEKREVSGTVPWELLEQLGHLGGGQPAVDDRFDLSLGFGPFGRIGGQLLRHEPIAEGFRSFPRAQGTLGELSCDLGSFGGLRALECRFSFPGIRRRLRGWGCGWSSFVRRFFSLDDRVGHLRVRAAQAEEEERKLAHAGFLSVGCQRCKASGTGGRRSHSSRHHENSRP